MHARRRGRTPAAARRRRRASAPSARRRPRAPTGPGTARVVTAAPRSARCRPSQARAAAPPAVPTRRPANGVAGQRRRPWRPSARPTPRPAARRGRRRTRRGGHPQQPWPAATASAFAALPQQEPSAAASARGAATRRRAAVPTRRSGEGQSVACGGLPQQPPVPATVRPRPGRRGNRPGLVSVMVVLLATCRPEFDDCLDSMTVETESCTRFRHLSTSTHVKSATPLTVVDLDADAPCCPPMAQSRDPGRDRRGAGAGVQGARRPGPAAADVDDRLGRGRRGLRLRPHPGVRAVRADDLAPPQGAARGRPGRRRTPRPAGSTTAPGPA